MLAYGHSECNESKFAYRNYYLPDVDIVPIPGESSCDLWSYIVVPSRNGDCAAIGGCTWFATHLLFYSANNSLLTFINEPGFACEDLVESNNTECLKTTRIPLGSELSKSLFVQLIFEASNDTQTWSSYYFEAEVCVFQYACAYSNTTMYTDPRFVIDPVVKRSLSTPETLHAIYAKRAYDSIMENADQYGQSLVNSLQNRKRALENIC
jgi:hypothetical protein